MKKIIVLDYITGGVAIVTIVDELLDRYDGDIAKILIDRYEFYHPEMEWMDLALDEFSNFDVHQDTLYEG